MSKNSGGFKYLLFQDNSGQLMQAEKPVNSFESSCVSAHFYDFNMKSKRSYFFARKEVFQNNNVHLNFSKPHLDWQEPSQQDFSSDLSFLKESFLQKKAQKAVPICFQRSSLKMTEENIDFIKTNWLENYKSSEHSLFLKDDDFCYMGFSPEILFTKKGNQLKTVALAGTRDLRKDYSELEFLNNEKDRLEHKFVADSLDEDLSAYGKVSRSEVYVQNLKNLAHLRTDFEVELKTDIDDESLIALLHPTPALGVYPRKSLSSWFAEHNTKQQRSFFGAPILIRDGEYSKCIVGIRSLFYWQDTWHLGSGCGVVLQSELDKEWAELQAKRESVLDKLGLL